MTLTLHPYSDEYVQKFATTSAVLRKLLGATTEIEHVGSTAVPGLGGKGIVDILILLDTPERIEEARCALLQAGYFGSQTGGTRIDRVFMASTEDESTEGDTHLHIVLKNSRTSKQFVQLRDYLRVHPGAAQAYMNAKQDIAEKTSRNREDYKKSKSEFVKRLLQDAENET